MGIIGHDLRSPLHTVIMVADLLLRVPSMPPMSREHLLRLRRAAGRMQEMIDTLLDFTRARFLGKVPISRVPSELGEISRAVIDEMRVVWPDNAIELDVRGDTHGEWDPAAHDADDLEPPDQRHLVRRDRHRRGRLDRGQRAGRRDEGPQPWAADRPRI